MPDYYSLLVQKIREAETDSGKLRELVYEAARLALRRHVNVHYPALSVQDGKRLLSDLEAAIVRVETDAGGAADPPEDSAENKPRPTVSVNRNDRAPETFAEEFDFLSARERAAEPARAPGATAEAARSDEGSPLPARDDVQRTYETRCEDHGGGAFPTRTGAASAEHREDDGPAVKTRLAQAGAELLDWPLAESREPAARELVPLSDQPASMSRSAGYLTRPSAVALSHADSYWGQSKPRYTMGRRILIGIGIASHVVVGVLAGTALYMTMSAPPATVQDNVSASRAPARSSAATRSVQGLDFAADPATTASVPAATTTTAASAAIALLADFPRPTAYGVYAISNSQLIELEQVPATPVDPRTRNNFQIVKAGRTVINDPKLSFLVYRRDLTLSPADKVPVRIAARVARSMTLDPLGKAVMEPPPVETWLIRDMGYDFRAFPVSSGSEMMMLRPEDDNFAFPAGRYELLLGGLAYDFIIAGIARNPAHCVEGVTTPRGLVFYECRTR